MDQPLLVADKEGMGNSNGEVVHALRPLLQPHHRHETDLAVRLPHMLAHRQLGGVDPPTCLRVERMLRRGFDLLVVQRQPDDHRVDVRDGGCDGVVACFPRRLVPRQHLFAKLDLADRLLTPLVATTVLALKLFLQLPPSALAPLSTSSASPLARGTSGLCTPSRANGFAYASSYGLE